MILVIFPVATLEVHWLLNDFIHTTSLTLYIPCSIVGFDEATASVPFSLQSRLCWTQLGLWCYLSVLNHVSKLLSVLSTDSLWQSDLHSYDTSYQEIGSKCGMCIESVSGCSIKVLNILLLNSIIVFEKLVQQSSLTEYSSW